MADSKVSDLTDAGTLDGDELLYVVDDPSGTAVSRRTTAAEVVASAFSGASVYRDSTHQSFNVSELTEIEFNAENFDTDDYHDNATNNTRLTVPEAGKYALSGSVSLIGLTTSGTGGHDTQVLLYVNGTFARQIFRDETRGNNVTVPVSATLDLSASDYIEVVVFHSGSGSPEVRSGSEWNVIDIQKVG